MGRPTQHEMSPSSTRARTATREHERARSPSAGPAIRRHRIFEWYSLADLRARDALQRSAQPREQLAEAKALQREWISLGDFLEDVHACASHSDGEKLEQ